MAIRYILPSRFRPYYSVVQMLLVSTLQQERIFFEGLESPCVQLQFWMMLQVPISHDIPNLSAAYFDLHDGRTQHFFSCLPDPNKYCPIFHMCLRTSGFSALGGAQWNLAIDEAEAAAPSHRRKGTLRSEIVTA